MRSPAIYVPERIIAAINSVLGTDWQTGGTEEVFLIHVQDQKSTGTDGGTSSAATDHTRVLNTVVTNTIVGASLASDQITLPAGDYVVWAHAIGNRPGRHRCFIFDTTNTAVVLLGRSSFSSGSETVSTSVEVQGAFTLAGEADLELRHYIESAQADNGLGEAVSDGRTEIYSDVLIQTA